MRVPHDQLEPPLANPCLVHGHCHDYFLVHWADSDSETAADLRRLLSEISLRRSQESLSIFNDAICLEGARFPEELVLNALATSQVLVLLISTCGQELYTEALTALKGALHIYASAYHTIQHPDIVCVLGNIGATLR
ncbi:uncharacterized protein BJ171DRAFT_582401 [Polychytrium aggregatum]|uniref:uncharacterized protein n=1 Tax=Polychytrium aggregatum TaxID=110093 RepID=UPI0022FDF483|nr:uncharacterized protein BJ171DRAFT_582401 [Polychytrium aggregatum]KAI9204025.1 hypothetical protein BJ171DRAFT_582401 [Polychytrium aggregatum]